MGAPPQRKVPDLFRLRLTTRLMGLVAIALLPAIIIQASNEIALRRTRETAIRQEALDMARAVTKDLGRVVENVRQTLLALAETPALRSQEPARCKEFLAALGQSYPGYISIGMNDTEGRIICSSSDSPAPADINADRAYHQRVRETGRFAVGDHVIGRVTGKRSIHFALPVRNTAGAAAGIVVAGLDLDWLTSHLAAGLPETATLTVTDRNGIVMVRLPDGPQWAGRSLPQEFRAELENRGERVVERSGLNGNPRIFGIAAPAEGDLAGFTITAGLSRAKAFAEIDAATQRGLLLIGLGAVFAFVAAWFGGRQLIRKPIEALLQASDRWRQGDWAARTNLEGTSELHRLGSAFDRMAGDLAGRETERREAGRREHLLMREVDHRARNALTVAQSLVRLTKAETIESYIAKVEGRVSALARSHTLLADNKWVGADLRELVEEELAAFRDRIRPAGPCVRLSAAAVQPLGLVLHELATNAAKHGALSAPDGFVELEWSRDAVGGITIRWCEQGGPEIPQAGPGATRPPGFGSRLIHGTAVRQLGAEISADWLPTGLCFTLRLPPGQDETAAGETVAAA
jgi:two-component sensor histidine kinase